jgi:peptidoglycan/xylan/chitin deacetylase (PgdA/CDA1 family)
VSRLRTRVLMYHDVIRDGRAGGFPGPGPARYKLEWSLFVEHMDRIADVVPTAPRVVDDRFREAPDGGWWSLTFDDGGVSALDVGEELVRRGWRAHFFVTTGRIGRPGFLDADGIRELDRMGHVIGSHSATHPGAMASLPAAVLRREWQASVAELSKLLDKGVGTASVPGGHYGRRVAVAAEAAGIEVLFTSEPVRAARGVGGCVVVGRYSVREGLTPRDAARVAAGAAGPWLRQHAAWNLRKPARMIAGHRYERIRRALLEARSRRPAA